MSGLASLALTGFFVWSGMNASAAVETAAPQIVTPATSDKTLSVRLTGYNAVPGQTDSNPDITASGAHSNPEVIAARSRDLAGSLPFGTIIALESPKESNNCGFGTVKHLIGYRVIADTMHERWSKKIDVELDTNDTVLIGVNGQPRKSVNAARALGMCDDVTLRVVGKIALKDIPETQAELAIYVHRALASK